MFKSYTRHEIVCHIICLIHYVVNMHRRWTTRFTYQLEYILCLQALVVRIKRYNFTNVLLGDMIFQARRFDMSLMCSKPCAITSVSFVLGRKTFRIANVLIFMFHYILVIFYRCMSKSAVWNKIMPMKIR